MCAPFDTWEEHWQETCDRADAEQAARQKKKGKAAKPAKGNGGDDGEHKTQSDLLVEIAAKARLFHTADQEGFADITVDGHRETHRICGAAFRRWLRHEFYKLKKRGCNADALKVAVETMDAMALFEGESREVHIRVAKYGDDIYIDIGDAKWCAIKVSKTGWEVVADPPVRFQRSPSMKPLPIPEKGGSIDLLRPLCNVSNDGFVLLVADLLAALRPDSNYPVLVLTGEQGCGKSSLARLFARLTDPRLPEQRSMPRSEEDLLVAAKGQHVLSFDNISGLPLWLSDALCRLSTGGGAGKRKLYTDEEEVLFSGRRPVVLNGIEDVVTRPDLVDRALIQLLETIPENKRRDESDFGQQFERVAGKILGALLDGLVAGLKNLATIKMTNKPRMADFALWAEAGTRAYWPAETFLRAYRENVARAVDLTIEASPVAVAVQGFMADRIEWTGTASELLSLLTDSIGEQAARARGWPKQASAFSGRLRRVAPPLRRIGIDISFEREAHTGTRVVHIMVTRRPEDGGKRPSPSSPPSVKGEKPNKINGRGGDAGDGTVTRGDAEVTLAGQSPSPSNPLKQGAFDERDAGDGVLHPSQGTVPNDYDAVIEELAARTDVALVAGNRGQRTVFARYDDAVAAAREMRAAARANGGPTPVKNDPATEFKALLAQAVPDPVDRRGCDFCGKPGTADQPLQRVGDGDGRQAYLHRACEVPWLNSKDPPLGDPVSKGGGATVWTITVGSTRHSLR
jgi:energy-coupling factor transporter ATP-binding protein EcfA2